MGFDFFCGLQPYDARPGIKVQAGSEYEREIK